MSHTSTVKNVNITNVELFTKAMRDVAAKSSCTVELLNDTIPHLYWEDQHKIKSEVVYRVRGKGGFGSRDYNDIGLQKSNDGYELVFDNHANLTGMVFGNRENPMGKAHQEYIANVMEEEIREQDMLNGFTSEVTREYDAEGNLELSVVR